ncbi:hypothetical protein ACJIZ3_004545 [Penstemon smallii]|uniref:DUF4228 domain-containing protein n=1 Tax=Penstemon smallii TaxID=265156 RepID=A0ABD3S2C4_9LAMI
MGNCQAIDIDNASLVIQHPNGKIENLYTSVSAKEIMKINPGHYVALLITTTLYSSSAKNSTGSANNNKIPLRITRIKLLRPTDTLVLGHVYRLVTTKEVMKGVWAKKQQARMKQKQNPDYYVEKYGNITEKEISDYEAIVRKNEFQKTNQVKNERHRRRNNTHAAAKSKAWQPSLNSISEAGS